MAASYVPAGLRGDDAHDYSIPAALQSKPPSSHCYLPFLFCLFSRLPPTPVCLQPQSLAMAHYHECAYQLTLVLHSLTHHPLPSPWPPCLLTHTSQPCFTWYSYQIPCVPHAPPLCICPPTVPRSQSHTHQHTVDISLGMSQPSLARSCTANVLGSDWSVMPKPGSCQTFEVPAVDDVSHRRCTAAHPRQRLPIHPPQHPSMHFADLASVPPPPLPYSLLPPHSPSHLTRSIITRCSPAPSCTSAAGRVPQVVHGRGR
jgi:hypothetical protein